MLEFDEDDYPFHLSIEVADRKANVVLGTSVFCENADEVLKAIKLFRKDSSLRPFLAGSVEVTN